MWLLRSGDKLHLWSRPRDRVASFVGSGDGNLYSAATAPGSAPLRLRFRLIPGASTDRWWLDDVRVEEIAALYAFQEENGQVVMEAEHFTLSVKKDNRDWLSQANLSGHVGPGYLTAAPDTGLLLDDSYSTTSPALQYTFRVTTTGVYSVWLRGYAPDAAGDSVYIGLDTLTPLTPTLLTGFDPQQWSWANQTDAGTPAVVEINQAGRHTLYLWQCEDGLRLDRILLTTNSAYVPVEDGPAENEVGP